MTTHPHPLWNEPRCSFFHHPLAHSSPFQWSTGQRGNSECHSVSLHCGLAKGLKIEVWNDRNISYRFPLQHKSSHFLQLEINPTHSTAACATTVGLSRKSLLRGASKGLVGERRWFSHQKKYGHSNFPVKVRPSMTPWKWTQELTTEWQYINLVEAGWQ